MQNLFGKECKIANCTVKEGLANGKNDFKISDNDGRKMIVGHVNVLR